MRITVNPFSLGERPHIQYAVAHVTNRMTPIVLRVKELRTAQGLTQQQLAKRAGIRQAKVSKMESGRAKAVDIEGLEKQAKALGCDPGYLIVKRGR